MWQDHIAGPPGSPERAEFDALIDELHRRDKRALRLTLWLKRIPLIGEPLFVFYYTLLYEGPAAIPDAMSFSFLGDFMFHGQPITQRYADSWMSRIHSPIHIRKGEHG